jgi:hypothetical protein
MDRHWTASVALGLFLLTIGYVEQKAWAQATCPTDHGMLGPSIVCRKRGGHSSELGAGVGGSMHE